MSEKSVVLPFLGFVTFGVWAFGLFLLIDMAFLNSKYADHILYGPVHNVTMHGPGKPTSQPRRVKDMKPGEIGYTFKYGVDEDGKLNPMLRIESEPTDVDNVKILRTENGFEMWPPISK